ncbi:MAG: tetratricopeptide repeat protein [Thiofilum sp.]|uniref:tetratricopeptide repeat protein n=1 Tax=Thiofilum sp. TaxID=2212733 RepID=UPI0025E01B46|nr:tetratricopeptide repeat protein [Thiofilum sp.]MBK8453388.1 ATP-binding protein [Thiofilum sp.]
MSDSNSSPATSSERKARLLSQLEQLWKQHDFETRVEEKLRLKNLIDDKQIELNQILGTISDSPSYQQRIHSDRLPTVKGAFFGREKELALLNAAWAGNGIRIIQFIAAGGTGKTKLIRHWLDTAAPENLIAWSFYSQGSSEDKQTSATPFFSHVFEVLKAEKRLETDFSSPEAKGEYLAQLLNQQRCVLVLDGLEPMQYADKANRGELKDRALRALLKNLAGSGIGLCIITTRIAVHELCDRAQVISHNLHNLALPDGVQLLESLGVKGRKKELERAVEEYGCHALALSLLGNLLRIRYQGDVHKRLTLKSLVTTSKTKENQHAFKVMQAYAEYFVGQTELALLSLLGLFDHPIEIEVLRVLWEAQIPALTAGIDEGEWWEAIEALRQEYQLLAERVGGEELDCHPLIREYFGKRLEEGQPEVWRAAHARLYEYYKNLPEKEFPDTLEEMQPLFHAVAHGCRAGLHQKVFNEVYWNRIQRKSYFLHRKLGAFSEDLNLISNFFISYWDDPVSFLAEDYQTLSLNVSAFFLNASGRLQEALKPAHRSLELRTKQKKWLRAAHVANTLSISYLYLGDISAAVEYSRQSLSYADETNDIFQKCSKRASLAYILHCAGNSLAIEESLELFKFAESMQSSMPAKYKYLFSLSGYYYCDLLIYKKDFSSLLDRASYLMDMARKTNNLLDFAISHLIYAKIYLQKEFLINSEQDILVENFYLNEALKAFKEYDDKTLLPLGLCIRAHYYRYAKQYTKAHTDLQEVYDIAEHSGMRLHLTDYHLEMARLLIAEGKEPINKIQDHVDKAEKLINATGYHRRDKELAELKEQLRNWDDE